MRPTPAFRCPARGLLHRGRPAPNAREVAYLRAAQAQAVRIAAMTDDEVARELALAEGEPAAERPRAEFGSLDHWLELLRCRERPTVAAWADCYAGAARLHEAAERSIREQTTVRCAVRTWCASLEGAIRFEVPAGRAAQRSSRRGVWRGEWCAGALLPTAPNAGSARGALSR